MVLAVDGDLAGTALHPDAGDRVLALAGGVGAALRVNFLHVDPGSRRRRVAFQRSKIFKRHSLAHGLGRPCILGIESSDVELHRVLRLVRMLGAGIDAQIPELLTAKRSARDHALDRLFQYALRVLAFEDLGGGTVLDAAWVSRMPVIDLVGALIAG